LALRILADGERDAELAQAADGTRRVLGRLAGAADDRDQVRPLRPERGDGFVARGPEPAKLGVAWSGAARSIGHQKRRMRADRGRDQHA
jgi:hypothetical protein